MIFISFHELNYRNTALIRKTTQEQSMTYWLLELKGRLNSLLHTQEECKGFWASGNQNPELVLVDVSSLSDLYLRHQLHFLSRSRMVLSTWPAPWLHAIPSLGLVRRADHMVQTRHLHVNHTTGENSEWRWVPGCQADQPISAATILTSWYSKDVHEAKLAMIPERLKSWVSILGLNYFHCLISIIFLWVSFEFFRVFLFCFVFWLWSHRSPGGLLP